MYLSVNFCVFPTSFIVAFEHHKIIKKWLYLWRTMNLYMYTYIYFYPKLVRLFLGKVMPSASDKVSLHNSGLTKEVRKCKDLHISRTYVPSIGMFLKTACCCLQWNATFRGCLVYQLKHMFSVFKQHYTHFHTLFHPYVYSKKLKTVV